MYIVQLVALYDFDIGAVERRDCIINKLVTHPFICPPQESSALITSIDYRSFQKDRWITIVLEESAEAVVTTVLLRATRISIDSVAALILRSYTEVIRSGRVQIGKCHHMRLYATSPF